MAGAYAAAAQEIEADFALPDAVTIGGVHFDYRPGAFWPHRLREPGGEWLLIETEIAAPKLVPIEGTVTRKALAVDPAFIDFGGGATFYVRQPNRSWVGKIDGGGAPGNPSPTAYMTWDEKKAFYKKQTDACNDRCEEAAGPWAAIGCPAVKLLLKNAGNAGAAVCVAVVYTGLQWCKSACPSPEPLPEPPEPAANFTTFAVCFNQTRIAIDDTPGPSCLSGLYAYGASCVIHGVVFGSGATTFQYGSCSGWDGYDFSGEAPYRYFCNSTPDSVQEYRRDMLPVCNG